MIYVPCMDLVFVWNGKFIGRQIISLVTWRRIYYFIPSDFYIPAVGCSLESQLQYIYTDLSDSSEYSGFIRNNDNNEDANF